MYRLEKKAVSFGPLVPDALGIDCQNLGMDGEGYFYLDKGVVFNFIDAVVLE